MTDTNTPSKKPQIVHWVCFTLLFLMMAQPTFDNIVGLVTGTIKMGEVTLDVTFSKMILHIIAMTVGWVGLGLFFKRRKLGAYVSIVAHLLGFTAAMTQTPEMLEAMPPAAIAVFFVVLFAATLGPIFAFKESYS
mgnify:CR=1 FL=1